MTGSGAESLEVCHGMTEKNRKVTNSNLGSHFFRRDVNEKQALTLPPFHVASHGPLPAHGAIFTSISLCFIPGLYMRVY